MFGHLYVLMMYAALLKISFELYLLWKFYIRVVIEKWDASPVVRYIPTNYLGWCSGTLSKFGSIDVHFFAQIFPFVLRNSCFYNRLVYTKVINKKHKNIKSK